MASPLSAPADIRLSDLLNWSVPVLWHEAVAVVRLVGMQVSGALDEPASAPVHRPAPRRENGLLQWPPPPEDLDDIATVDVSGRVPPPSGIWLSHSGTVSLDTSGAAPGDTVVALASLLKSILPPVAPAELLLLADADRANIRGASPQKFIEALTFFARPDDYEEIRNLVARALDARVTNERAAALAALTERARQSAPATGAVPVLAHKSLNMKRLLTMVAVLSLLAATGLGAWIWLRQPAPANPAGQAQPTSSADPARSVQQSLASAATYVREAIAGPPPASVGRGADVVLPAPGRRRSRRPADNTGAAAATSPDTPAATPGAPNAQGEGGGPFPREMPETAGMSPSVTAAPHGVYSAANPDVIPPAIVRAQMPEVPIGGLPIEPRGVLELTIGEDGQVTNAKLVPASNRHQDRMMVSAAKTWRFSPATRDGLPVRYRLQMPITW